MFDELLETKISGDGKVTVKRCLTEDTQRAALGAGVGLEEAAWMTCRAAR